MSVQTQEQRFSTLVGKQCEHLVGSILKELASEELISYESQIDLSRKLIGGNFKLDFLVTRLADEQRIALFISHRESSENSDAYFWGLVEEVRQTRKVFGNNTICCLLIMGDKKGWKNWIFPLSLLFFDYTFFVGNTLGETFTHFTFTKAKVLEIEAKRRISNVDAPDVDKIVRRLMRVAPEKTVRQLDQMNIEDLNVRLQDEKKKIEKTKDGIRSCLNIGNLSINVHVASIYRALEEFIGLPTDLNEVSGCEVYVNREGILRFVTYLLLLHFHSLRRNDLINLLRQFYPSYDPSRWINNAISLLEKGKILVPYDNSWRLNPEVILPILEKYSDKEKKVSVSKVCRDFVYGIIDPKLSNSQRAILDSLSKRNMLELGVPSVLKTLKSFGRSGEILGEEINKRKRILNTRHHVLMDWLKKLEERNVIRLNLVLGKAIAKILTTDTGIDKGQALFLHRINVHSDLFDSYCLYLSKEYRDEQVKVEFERFVECRGNQDNLLKTLNEVVGDGLRVFAEVALYTVGLTPNEVRNLVERGRAGTKTYAFLRGDRVSLSTDEEQALVDLLITRPIVNSIEDISNGLLKRRVQQIERNNIAKIHEEEVYAYLAASKFLFLGLPETQSDIYIVDVMSEIGFEMPGKPGRVIYKGEDFVVPRSDGGIIAVACRASPQSYEARRMCGHSVQFLLMWDPEQEKWKTRENMFHVAIVDGSWKKNWVQNLLSSVFEKVFSSDELSNFVLFLKQKNCILYERDDYGDILRKVNNELAVTKLTPGSIQKGIQQVVAANSVKKITNFM